MYINEKIVRIITFHLFAREILRSKYSSMRVCSYFTASVCKALGESWREVAWSMPRIIRNTGFTIVEPTVEESYCMTSVCLHKGHLPESLGHIMTPML